MGDAEAGLESSPISSSESHMSLLAGEYSSPKTKVDITRTWNPVAYYFKCRRAKIVTVEPVLFLYMFGLYLFLSSLEQYLFNRYGREKFISLMNYTGPWNWCMSYEKLDNITEGLGNKVEEETSDLNLITGVTGQFPSIFAALLYGPLSDRIGRKPIMLTIATVSCITASLTLVIMYFNLNLNWLILVSAINALGGSFPGMLTALYSYIADVGSNKWLTLRLGFLESMIFISGTLALSLVGVWLTSSNCWFEPLIWLFLASNIAILIYVILLLPESLTPAERKERMKRHPSGFAMLIRGVKIFFIKQYSRWRLWVSLYVMAIIYLVAIGASNVSTLFLLNKPLQWTPKVIGLFQSMSELVNGLALLLLLPILVAIRLPDALIILIGGILAIVMFIAQGLVQHTWEMFLVGVVQGVAAIAGPGIRSIMSKAIAVEDQGALFSIIAGVQVLSSVTAAVVFFYFYPATLKMGWKAGSVYFLMAVILLLAIPGIVVLLVFRNAPGALHRVEPGSKPPAGQKEPYLDEKAERDSLLSELSRSSTAGYGGAFPDVQSSIQCIDDT